MKRKKRILLCICAAALLLAGTVTGVYARYFRSASENKSPFTSAESIDPTVNEEFSGGAKENVSVAVGDTDYPVYVRAAIVITWQNADGIVYFSKPVAGRDYILTLNLDVGGWTSETDGYYYYKSPVSSRGETDVLITSCTQNGAAPADGYALNVEIIAQTVQAIGYTDDDTKQAYQDAWGIS